MAAFVPPPLLNQDDSIDEPDLSSSGSTTKAQVHFARLCGILQRPIADINTMRYYCRRGLPDQIRGEFWRILLGCSPLGCAQREEASAEHLKQYTDFTTTCCSDIDSQFVDKFRVDVDIGRTLPSLHFFASPPREEIERARKDAEEASASGEAPLAAEESVDGMIPQVWTHNQKALRRVLHLFSRLNPGLGYVQGMNEVVGHLMYAFSEGQSAVTPQIEAEVFFCFQALSRYLGDNFCRTMDFDPSSGVMSCLSRYRSLLFLADNELCEHLDSIELKPEFYAFRWITLMFTQEFLVPDVLLIWDYLFADVENIITTIIFFSCSMIISLRDDVLPMQFPQALQFIQSYPPTIEVGSLIEMTAQLEERFKRTYAESIASPTSEQAGNGSNEGVGQKAKALFGSFKSKIAATMSRGAKEEGGEQGGEQ